MVRLPISRNDAEFDRFLDAMESTGDVPPFREGEDARLTRLRGLLKPHFVEQALVTEGITEVASGLMGLAAGRFEFVLEPTGENDLVDAAYIGMSMLAEELEHSRSEMERARDEALAANLSKSSFLANMSHELRTPLNAIIGYCELIADDVEEMPGAESMRVDLARILSSSHHLLGLISDVLDLSKIEAGRMDLDIKPFSPTPLVEEVCRALVPKATERGNALTWDTGVAEVMVADGFRLKQVLFNLLGNAIKFTENGTVHVEIRSDGDAVCIDVTDTGPGIALSRQAAIFDPFTQADQETTREFGGTGLGLAITRRLCRLMQGDVSVQSVPGEGCTFTVRLPRDVRPVRSEVRGDLPVVLIVDDDVIFRGLAARYLAGLRCHLEFAANGQEALAFAYRTKPDLILLDILMPTLDGWTTLTYLKAQPATADVPVVLVSVIDASREPAVLGASDFLVKPITRDALLSTVTRHLHTERKNILVVDDDPRALEIASRQLHKHGYEVRLARDGVEAMTALREAPCDLMLLDLNMPNKNGFEVIQEMAGDDALPDTPVVVVTAQVLSNAERAMLAGHVEQVITKGLGGSAVVGAVQSVLSHAEHVRARI